MPLQEYKTTLGEIILYNGKPDFEKLENLSIGAGDIWHSSFEQGYKNAFQEIIYFTAVFSFYLNDFDQVDECISWRINPYQFAVRKSVWKKLGGFDIALNNIQLQAFDFGFNSLRYHGAVPLYSKGLFTENEVDKIEISTKDVYVFYRRNFKIEHSLYMIYRKGFWKFSEWKAFFYAKNHVKRKSLPKPLEPRKLHPIEGNPTVSYIIPTMLRQDFTLNLLNDLKNQSYLPSQVIVVDATPEDKRDEKLYNPENYPFEVQFHWQISKGSCRARNEAINHCKGDYIIFGDDDIRLPSDFIENHMRFLQTNKAGACNGLDIRANHQHQSLEDLNVKLEKLGKKRWIAGATQMFSNANSCVKREFVNKLGGNDINFDGGYGEDSDFGHSLLKIGVTVLHNPYSVNLHLKPPLGGYRFWGTQAAVTGKKRKEQPWELGIPVGDIKPVPGPTIMYGILKHYNNEQVYEYKKKHFFFYLFKGTKAGFLHRFLNLSHKNKQYQLSLFYAKNLIKLGKRTK